MVTSWKPFVGSQRIAVSSGLMPACTRPVFAKESRPIALVGPSLLLVLLGVSGQLERNRYLARTAGVIGVVLSCICWATDWTIADVQRLPSGIFYPSPGPLTPLHFSQIAIWLVIGIIIARRSTGVGERKKLVQLQSEASNYKPYSTREGAPQIPENLALDISRTTSSIVVYEQALARTRSDQQALRETFNKDIERFRELKGG